MADVTIKINGYEYSMKKGITILDASFETMKFKREFLNQPIPTLYYLKGVMDIDESGVCVVQADGEIVNASTTRIKDGMEIFTRTPDVIEARKEALAKILKIHNKSCLHCLRSTSCELQELLHEYGFTDEQELPKEDPVSYTHLDVYKRQRQQCVRERKQPRTCE